MENIFPNKGPTMEEMKESILRAGGSFYQYRPCRRNASTIYDIENIRHGVVYAQTPLNMNDPFDSMIGFSSEKIYNNIISMLTEALDVEENIKAIISMILQYRSFGKIGELIILLKDQQQYLLSRRKTMHQNHIPLQNFVLTHASVLYSKAPKELKKVFSALSFTAFSILISQIGKIEISESSISEMLKLDDILDGLHSQAENIRDTVYVPELKKFLSKLTVSCFSASGWDNQLMWSHYTNSYSGICVEYNFSKITEFCGFIYPVIYTQERPTLSMQDLGFVSFDLKSEEKIIKGETDITNIFSYLLCKNTCWNYEDEWRIINIGDENTPIFINLPYIKSITFGINTDVLCKRILLAICKEKNIPCYEIKLSKDSYYFSRVPIIEMPFDIDEEVAYVTLLSDQMNKISQLLKNNTEKISETISQNSFDSKSFISVLMDTEDFLCSSYFLKSSLNRVCENFDEFFLKTELPSEIISAISGIDSFALVATHFIDEIQKPMLVLRFKSLLKGGDYIISRKHITNIKELIERFNNYSWNSILLSVERKTTCTNINNDDEHDDDLLYISRNKGEGGNYELLRRIDFSKTRNNPEKQHLKKLFVNWLNQKYPNVNTEDTYFSDALFIGNNPSLGLDIVEIISDEEEGRIACHTALVKHFELKGYDSNTANAKAKEYLNRLDQLKEFLDDYEKNK